MPGQMSSSRYERVRQDPLLGLDHADTLHLTVHSRCRYCSHDTLLTKPQPQVAAADDDYLPTPTTPNSPPPSFRSHDSSPNRARSSSHPALADQNLADAFDADGSDSDDDNDGDDRQRLMRGTPTDSSSAHETPGESESDAPPRTDGAIQLADTRPAHTPVFAPTIQGRVYGGGSGSDGVFANLSAKPERGEKIEEHPPVRPRSLY